MWARLRRFRALPRPAQGLFLRALFLLPLITLLLRLRGFRAAQRALHGWLGSPAVAGTPGDLAATASRMVRAAARNSVFPSTCLERSLALWWLLARRGVAAQLRIGVRKSGEKFEAHAWVEREGQAIDEPEGAHLHYAPFAKEFSEDPS
jgi:Transglutaminase-like superfamily